MKIAILIFCAMLALASAADSITTAAAATYTNVPPSQWQTPAIQSSLSYGIQQLLNIAVKNGKIPNTDYSLFKTNSIQQQPSGKSVNYKFNVLLVNPQETSNITATFVVNYVTSNGAKSLTSYSYNVTTNTTPFPRGPYVLLTSSQVKNNPDVQASLTFAENSIYQIGVNAGKIPAGTYTVVSTTVWSQQLNTGYNYKAEVVLTKKSNSQTVTLDENFVVYSPTSGKRVLSSWSYEVTTKNGN